VSYQIPAGSHTLQWRYRKNGFGSAGADAGWVDRISLSDPDTDADGLPDPWETANFGNLSRDGTGDFDSDGATDLAEYLAGTGPTNPNSILAITGLHAQAGGQYQVTWDSVPGRAYQIEVSPDLQSWVDLGSKVVADSSVTSALRTPPTSVDVDVTLVPEGAPVRALVPSSDIGTLWRGGNEPSFAAAGGDTSWLSGTTGVGYDNNTGAGQVNYLPFIGLSLGTSPVTLPNTSVFCRVRFNLSDPTALSSLTLRMRTDDGFASWINGQSLPASQLAPSNDPAWNATSSGSTNDAAAIVYVDFALPGPYTYLRNGENILAIHALNQALASSDLLMEPMLIGRISTPLSNDRVFWRVRAEP
jgi:hypothetical protein